MAQHGWRHGRVGTDHQGPAVERSLISNGIVGDFEGPRSLGVGAIENRQRARWPITAVEWDRSGGYRGRRFVVQNGADEVVAACPQVGEQLHPSAVRGNEVNVQVAIVGVHDVDLDVDVGDRQGMLDRDGRRDRRQVDDGLGDVAGRILVARQ